MVKVKKMFRGAEWDLPSFIIINHQIEVRIPPSSALWCIPKDASPKNAEAGGRGECMRQEHWK